MSDGTLNLPKRSTAPASPDTNRYKIYVDGNDDEVKYIDEFDVIRTFKGDQGDTGPAGPQGPAGNDGSDGAQGPQGPAGPMTVEAFISETGTVTLPNSTAKQDIYTDNVTISATGDCYLDISLAFKPHLTNSDAEFDIEFNNSVLTPEYVEEHKDSSNPQEVWRAQCLDLGNVAAGTYPLTLRFSKEATGGTAQLKNYTAKLVRYS